MTTAQILSMANLDGIKGGVSDANARYVLHHKLVPEFLHDIGYPSWIRKYANGSLAASARFFDIADDDLRQVRKIVVAPDYDTPLTYIGDDDALIFAAMATTETGAPTAYWLGYSGSTFSRVFVDRIADTAYTMPMSYYRRIPFPNDTDSLELNPYIPYDCQWPLVEYLKRYYYGERLGIEDTRFQLADGEINKWIERLRENPEKSSGAKYAYVT